MKKNQFISKNRFIVQILQTISNKTLQIVIILKNISSMRYGSHKVDPLCLYKNNGVDGLSQNQNRAEFHYFISIPTIKVYQLRVFTSVVQQNLC